MATPSYKERLAAARAATRAERQAREQAWKRRIELECEVRRLALDAVKAGIRARGDKLQLLHSAASEARLGSRDCKLVGAAVVRRRILKQIDNRLVCSWRSYTFNMQGNPVAVIGLYRAPNIEVSASIGTH